MQFTRIDNLSPFLLSPGRLIVVPFTAGGNLVVLKSQLRNGQTILHLPHGSINGIDWMENAHRVVKRHLEIAVRRNREGANPDIALVGYLLMERIAVCRLTVNEGMLLRVPPEGKTLIPLGSAEKQLPALEFHIVKEALGSTS